jgi:iron complex outermembrane recepter protein
MLITKITARSQFICREILLLSLSAAASPAMAEEQARIPLLSLEQLINQKVTSVSKQTEKASQAAASIYVINSEDIRRSGATSVAELLRYVPGIEVARSGSSQWAVTSRGFNAQFANKLLVLVDGRSVYTPLFSGVYWDEQNPDLQTIDRIEVIRGPGATMWGANAVNGVINIITKDALSMQGSTAQALVGNAERSLSVHHGGTLGGNAHYRTYVRRHDMDAFNDATGRDANDAWRLGQAGYRVDWEKGNDALTLQSDYFEGHEHYNYIFPQPIAPFVTTLDANEVFKGGNVLLNARRQLGESGEVISFKTYLDREERVRNRLGTHIVETLDGELQYQRRMGDRHELVMGAGYRLVSDDLTGSFYLSFNPQQRQTQMFSGFLQDKIMLVNDQLYVTLGSKIEHNDYTGAEFQPNARLSWQIDENNTAWASVSRAVREPNRTIDDVSLVLSGTSTGEILRQIGNRGIKSEQLYAYELGYRSRVTENASYDISLFYNSYDDLYINQTGTPVLATSVEFGNYTMIPWDAFNTGKGNTYGGEVSMNWNVTDMWRLAAGYAYLQVDVSGMSTIVTREGTSPQQQASLRSYFNITPEWELDTFLYYVDSLPKDNIPAYLRADIRVGWRPSSTVEVSVTGQNLLDPTHPEFSPFLYNAPTEVGRAVVGRVTWSF